MLLDRLNASATPQDQQWLSALRQAMAESDAAVAKISAADAPSRDVLPQDAPSLALPRATGEGIDGSVDGMLDMIRGAR